MKERKGRGLSLDKNLSVNKNAGYKFVKKDKSVNKRAGLHDKKRDIAEGERRVVRCKPLALKHKRRMRKAAVVLAAICVGAVSYVGMGFLFKPDGLFVEDLGNYTVKAQNVGDTSTPKGGGKTYYFPEDGSLPTDHTLIENVAYLNYVLSDVQTCWSSYMESTVYTVMQQHVYTHKKSYKDEDAGVYSFVSADMAVGASNTAEQFCVTEEEVIWRKATGYISLEDMDKTEWDKNVFYGNTIDEFRSYRGLPANDFSVYILDENTVKNANETSVTDNGDGTYSMTLDLKVHQSGLDSAVHYYKQTMYVNGGLYAWPTFDYTRVTYTFTADWQLLSFTINDGYSAKMGVIAAACTSESTTVFSYEKETAVNSYRPDEFAPHENGNYNRYSPFGNERKLDAATCLANAFGSVLEEGATFKIDLGLNGREVSGAIYVGLEDGGINDLRVSLGDLKVYLGGDNGKNTLFLAAGKDKFRLCTDGLFGTESSSDAAAAQADGGSALDGILDVNDLMKQLFAGEFDLQEKSATLKSTLSLFGLDIPVEFAFKIKGLDATLDYVKTSFSLNGSPVTARLEFGTEEDIPAAVSESEKPLYKDILNGGLTLNLKLGIDNLVLNGAAEIKLADGKFKGVNAYLGDYAVYYSSENGLVYLNLGGYKYKLDTAKLSGGADAVPPGVSALSGEEENTSALQQIINFIVGGIYTDGNGLNFKGALAADNSFNVLGTALKLALDVNLKGYLGVNAKIDVGGKTVFAEVSVAEDNSAIPAIGSVDGYKDILNEGVTLGVALTVDGLKLDGVVDIAMNNGALAGVSAQLGDFTVYYTASGNTVYYSDASGNKYKIALGAGVTVGGNGLGGLLGGLDVKTLINEIIGNLSATDGNISTGANINLFEQTLEIAANISLNDGLKVGIDTEVLNRKVAATVYLAENTLPELNPEGYKDILNEGVTFDVRVKLDELLLSGNVFLGLTEGKITSVQANLSNDGGEIAVYYNSAEDMLYLKAGEGVKVKLPASVFGGAQTQSVNGILGGPDIKEILNQLLNNLGFAEKSLSASAEITLGEYTVIAGATLNLEKGLGADLTVDILNKNIQLNASLSGGAEVTELTTAQKAEYADVLNGGFNASGKISVDVGGTNMLLDVKKLAVSLAPDRDGNLNWGFALDTRLTVNDTYFDLYVSYLDGVATLVYGETDEENGDNYFGATLDIAGGDLNKLKDALVNVYNRISAVLDEIVTNNPLKPTDKAGLENQLTFESLSKILEKLGVAISVGDGAAGVFDMLGLPQTDGKIDIKGLIEGLKLYSPEGTVFGITLGNFTVQLKNTGLNASVDLEMANSSVRVYVQDLILGVYDAPDCPVAKGDLLTADDFADMLDYLGAAAELLVEDEYSLSANATVFEDGAVSYEVKVLFEYVRGEKFPVHVTVPETDENGGKTGLSVSFDEDMYWHLGVGLERNREFAGNYTVDKDGNKVYKDNLYVDVYILDCNPSVENGLTVNGKTTAGNGLDVFVSVSKYGSLDKDANFAPLKVYAPVNEILTVLSAGVALLNLQDIDVSEESAALQSVISQLAKLLDDALVKTYLPLTHSQFASLGESLLPQIIGSDISTLLKDVLGALAQKPSEDGADGEQGGEKPVVPAAKPMHVINNISLGTTGAGESMLKIALNSSAIYGDGYENITFEAYKNYKYVAAEGEETEVEPTAKSYITGAAVNNIYFGGNKKLDLGLGISRSVEMNTDFGGYYDFSGIDALLKAAVNSATHSKTNATELDKYIYGDSLTDYLLNRYYYLEGKIDLHVPVVNHDYQVGVALAVYIDESNDVTINASLDIPAMQEFNQIVTNGDTHVELTVKNGMLYIKRVQTTYWKKTVLITSIAKYDTPITVYRVMPLGEFSKNMMDNIVFLMNLGPVVTDNMNGGGTAEEPTKDLSDFGTQIGKYLKSFVYTGTSNSADWAITINGKSLLDITAIGLNDVVLTLNADSRYDELTNSRAYTLNGLTISTGLNLAGLVNITVNGKINYCNPQQVMNKKYNDQTVDSAAMWEELFGCSSGVLGVAASGLEEGTDYTEEEIAASERWQKAVASLNGNYTGKNFIEVNLSSSTGVNLGEVTLKQNGVKVGAITVLYGEKGLLSVAPAIPEWKEKTGYTLSVNYVGVTADKTSGKLDFAGAGNFANLAVNAVYTPNTYKINIIVDEEKGTVYTVDYVYGTRLKLSDYIGLTATAEDGAVYVLDSFVLDGKKYFGDIESFNTTEDVTLIANWSEFNEDAEYTVTYVADGKIVETLTFKYGEAIRGDIVPDFNAVGYDFAGWDFCGVETCYGDREINAIYAPHTYTVTLDVSSYEGCGKEGELAAAVAEAGFESGKLYYTYGEDAAALTALNPISGWDFVCYYVLDENGEKTEITSVYMLTEDITVYAEFNDVRIKLKLTSDVAFTYGGKSATLDGSVYELETYVTREDSNLASAENAEGWQFLGWWYISEDENGETAYNSLSDVLDIARPGETVETEIRALWGKVNITASSTKKGFMQYTYNLESSVSLEFVGYERVIETVNRTAVSYAWQIGSVAADKVSSSEGYNELSFDASHKAITASKWTLDVNVTLTVAGGNEVTVTGNTSGKY